MVKQISPPVTTKQNENNTAGVVRATPTGAIQYRDKLVNAPQVTRTMYHQQHNHLIFFYIYIKITLIYLWSFVLLSRLEVISIEKIAVYVSNSILSAA